MLQPVVTVSDFVLALEFNEVLELSNLSDPLATTVNEPKIQYALDRALETINSYYVLASYCGKASIKLQAKQLTIWLARYYLDTTKARPFIEEDEKKAIEALKYACSDFKCQLTTSQINEILGVSPPLVTRLSSGFRSFKAKNKVKRITNYYEY